MVIREGGVVEQCAYLKYLKGKILQKYPHLKCIAKLFFFLSFWGVTKLVLEPPGQKLQNST